MKITVIGAGYVGEAVAFVYAKRHDVWFYDTDTSKIDLIQQGKAPLGLEKEKAFFQANQSRIYASSSLAEAMDGSSYVFICVPTPLNDKTGLLDTSNVFMILDEIQNLENSNSLQIFIRSTINPLDSREFKGRFPSLRIHCFPEFLREKYFFEDATHPTRVVVGSDGDSLDLFLKDYLSGLECEPEVLIASNEEAMAVKILSNSYLAMRVAFFNEVDSFASANGLDSSVIIHGMGLDPRIGDYYNQPSNGYGGKCLPKDLQASSSMMVASGVTPTILETVHLSNEARKKRNK